MNKIQSSTVQPALQPAANSAVEGPDANADALPLSAPTQEQAATFERSKRSTRSGGDSRVIAPAGGGTGEVNNNAAIDGHSKKSGDYTEPRMVNGMQLFFTPEGAAAVDALLAKADESSAPLKAGADPGAWERFWKGDPFEGRELHSGKTK